MSAPQLTIRFPRGIRNATRARKVFTTFVCRLGVDCNTKADLERAVGEAIANAVEHGLRDGTHFEMRVSVCESMLRIEIEDDGRGFDPANPRSAESRGFGIGIMRGLVDRVTFCKNGRMVRLEKRLLVR